MTPEFEGLSLVDLINLLEPAPAPPPIPLTPQTPGWLVLAALVAVIAFLIVRWMLRRNRANAYRRAALTALEHARNDPAEIATILRRTALTAFPRADVATLAGPDWLRFLDDTFPGDGFADGPGQVVARAPYQPCPAAPDLARLARDWIRRHRSGDPA